MSSGLAVDVRNEFNSVLLAKHVDDAPIDGSDGGWHKVLLNRVSNPFPGIRDAIISEACHEGLDRFRSFRHRQRSNYGITLDADIVLERAEELPPVFELFHDDVTRFVERWSDATA